MSVTHHRPRTTAATLLAVATVLAGCGSAATTKATDPTVTSPASSGSTTGVAAVIDPGDGGVYHPELSPTDFVAVVDNPYLPFPDGATWRYEGTSDGADEVIEVTVTGDRKTILGISATVVRDTVTVDGAVVEDTYDWYAQDTDGNVWYLGEDVKDYEDGKLVSTEGSWEAGVDGALPGIVMPGHATAGDPYRQEYLAGEAEDMMQILETGSALTVAGRTYDDVIRTRDWTPVEPDVVEEKRTPEGSARSWNARPSAGTATPNSAPPASPADLSTDQARTRPCSGWGQGLWLTVTLVRSPVRCRA